MNRWVAILALLTGLALAACGSNAPSDLSPTPNGNPASADAAQEELSAAELPSGSRPDPVQGQGEPTVIGPPPTPMGSSLPNVALTDASGAFVSGDIVSFCIPDGCMETERPVYDFPHFVPLPDSGGITLTIGGAPPTQVMLTLLAYQDGLAILDAPADSTTLSAPDKTVSWQPAIVPSNRYILNVRVEWNDDFATYWFPIWLPIIAGVSPPTPTDKPKPAAGASLPQGEVTTEIFPQVEPGATRAEVEALLGAPDERQEMQLPEGPFWGPQEGLSAILEPGAPFEEWVYHRDGYDYYVWFAAPVDKPGEDWQVIQTASYPADAVF